MDFKKMTVVELKKQCKSLNIQLTKADGNSKLKSDLIKSLNNKTLSRGGSRKLSKRCGSRRVRKRIGSRRGSKNKLIPRHMRLNRNHVGGTSFFSKNQTKQLTDLERRNQIRKQIQEHQEKKNRKEQEAEKQKLKESIAILRFKLNKEQEQLNNLTKKKQKYTDKIDFSILSLLQIVSIENHELSTIIEKGTFEVTSRATTILGFKLDGYNLNPEFKHLNFTVSNRGSVKYRIPDITKLTFTIERDLQNEYLNGSHNAYLIDIPEKSRYTIWNFRYGDKLIAINIVFGINNEYDMLSMF